MQCDGHNTHFRTFRATLAGLLTTCLAAGCAQHAATKTENIGDAAACAALKTVIADAGTGFQSLRGSASQDYDHTRWDTKPILPGTDCDIVAWGGGRTHYGCTWDKGNEATARADYDAGLGLVSRCLGSGWQVSHPAGQSGEASRFARSDSPTTVEIRYYRERDPSRQWQTSLTIGPPITRDAR